MSRGKKANLTAEELAQMKQDYLDGDDIRKIATKYHMGTERAWDTLETLFADEGGLPERKRGGRGKGAKIRLPVCEHCGKKAPAGAKFCPWCGKSILTEREKIAEKVLWLRGTLLHHLPQENRKTYDEAFIEIRDFILKGDKK